ncbi:MAG: ParB/RepB/Spo0J family partition protein [Desulfatiglandales bacterium]
MEYHPAADSFPMMDGKRYQELLEDIREHGQLEPITLCEGMILDGRNRHKACLELGLTPKTRSYEGDPWAYAWSLNGQRRDLVDEQRYLIWQYCHEKSEAFQSEKRRIQEEANQKRSEAMQGVAYAPKGEHRKPEKVVEHNVPQPSLPRHKSKPAKAAAAKVNKGGDCFFGGPG